MSRNALDRDCTIDEIEAWLRQIQAGTSRSAVALTIAESAEHLTLGNGHIVTNNTLADNESYTREHPLDRAQAGIEVQNLYLTVLGRKAESSSVVIGNATGIASGSATSASVAAAMLGSAEFAAHYGTLSDGQFVQRMFANAYKTPTPQTSSFWTSMLGTGAVSRADFAVAVANTDQDSASVNRLIQAMATMTSNSAASSSLSLSAIGQQEMTLAAAHA